MARRLRAEGSLTAQNTFIGPIDVRGQFSLSISGTWAGTMTLQRAHDGNAPAPTYHDIPDDAWTTNQELNGTDETGAQYRVGFKTGEYTSGTAVVVLKAERNN